MKLLSGAQQTSGSVENQPYLKKPGPPARRPSPDLFLFFRFGRRGLWLRLLLSWNQCCGCWCSLCSASPTVRHHPSSPVNAWVSAMLA